MQNGIDQQQFLFQPHRRNVGIPQPLFRIIAIQNAHPVFLDTGKFAELTARRLDPGHNQRPQPVQMSNQNELTLMSSLPIGILEKFPQNGRRSLDDKLDYTYTFGSYAVPEVFR